MRKLKYSVLLVALFAVTISVNAQQETTISNYWSHMNVINPAYVGSDGMTNWKSTIRSQWTGISDAPETQLFSFSSPVGKNVGLGMSIVNDEVFIEKITYVAFDFSYKLNMSNNAQLYLGLKAAAQFYSVDTANLQTFNLLSDPALESKNTSYPNMGLGFLYVQDKFYLSLSAPRILNTERISVDESIATMATDKPHMYLSSGYRFELNPLWDLTPSFLMSKVENVPVLYDVNLLVSYNDMLDFGVTYRNAETFGATFSIDVSDSLTVGYSYETSSRTLLSTEWNTSEIYIGFSIPYRNKRGQVVDGSTE